MTSYNNSLHVLAVTKCPRTFSTKSAFLSLVVQCMLRSFNHFLSVTVVSFSNELLLTYSSILSICCGLGLLRIFFTLYKINTVVSSGIKIAKQ